MNPVSLLLPIPAFLLAIAAACFLVKRFGAPPDHRSFASLDGLRGNLAFLVVIHHSSVCYFYLQTGEWKPPPSRVYNNLGQVSLILFFMITGFLFFSKILDRKTKDLDWGKLFISRVLRLTPMYFFVMLLLFSTVAFLSRGILNEPLPELLKGGSSWLGFTIFGDPDLNGIAHTSTIVAGVTWSVAYEWFFYLSLPLLALAVRVKPPLPYLILGVAGVVGFCMWHELARHLLSFCGGIAASFLVRSNAFRQFAVGKMASLIVLVCGVLALTAFRSAHGLASLLLISTLFSLISGGNTLFGVFSNSVSRTMGEVAYSIYLLHGFMLFVMFSIIIGINPARDLSPLEYWMVIGCIAPILILTSFCTFQMIELPFMQKTNAVTAWLRSIPPLRTKASGERKERAARDLRL